MLEWSRYSRQEEEKQNVLPRYTVTLGTSINTKFMMRWKAVGTMHNPKNNIGDL